MKTIRFVGLDVHSDKIAVAVAEPDGELRFLGVVLLDKLREIIKGPDRPSSPI